MDIGGRHLECAANGLAKRSLTVAARIDPSRDLTRSAIEINLKGQE